jgi:hypothetical protein
LWSLSVAAEVVVFLLVGRPLLDRIGPAGAAMLSAGAGVVRWAVMAETAWLPAVAAIEPLHGLTFALLRSVLSPRGALDPIGLVQLQRQRRFGMASIQADYR